jgi:hypothetical protein
MKLFPIKEKKDKRFRLPAAGRDCGFKNPTKIENLKSKV